jgi:hypothetical protein
MEKSILNITGPKSPEREKACEEFANNFKILFEQKIKSGEWIKVNNLSRNEKIQIRTFAHDVAIKKVKEGHIKDKDEADMILRQINGKSGEVAVRNFLISKNISVSDIDWEISDESSAHHTFDLLIDTTRYGIKTSQKGKAILFNPNSTLSHSQIIVLKENDNIFIAGIASKSLLKNELYHDERLFYTKNDPSHPKTGLTIEGYKNLTPFQKLIEYISDSKPQIATS